MKLSRKLEKQIMRSLFTSAIILGTLQLYVVSCGPVAQYSYFDPTLEGIYAEYLEVTRDYPGHRLQVLAQTTDIEELGLLGQCNRQYGVGYFQRDVYVLPRHRFAGPLQYKALVFHELAHCIHDIDHDNNGLIMESSLYGGEQYWEKNWDVAIDDLINKIRGKQSRQVEID